MIPIFKPFVPYGITEELNEILYSGKLSYGNYGHRFEEKLKDYFEADYVLTISSYNQALLVVLSTLGLTEGDEIIASPVSCLASNQPFAVKGLKVIWADVDPATGSLSVDDVRTKITKKTKAIFHNHFCGYLGHVNELNELGKNYGIPVIDDCIEAFGSELGNKKVGSLGSDLAVFSFQTVRLPNTIDGGAIVFKDERHYQLAKMIRDYGIDRSTFRDELNEISQAHDIKTEGYGATMSEINSFLGLRQMEIIDDLLQIQRLNAKAWDKSIEKLEWISPLQQNHETNPNYWVYGATVKNKVDALKKVRQAGFYSTGVHINNNIYSVFKNNADLKGVTEFMNHFLALPCGWWVDQKDIKKGLENKL